jgi:hypothetical protein
MNPTDVPAPCIGNMNPTDVCATWKFVFNDVRYPNLPAHPDGYYINVSTNKTYAFRPGIKHIIGEDGELHVYNMWWLENG